MRARDVPNTYELGLNSGRDVALLRHLLHIRIGIYTVAGRWLAASNATEGGDEHCSPHRAACHGTRHSLPSFPLLRTGTLCMASPMERYRAQSTLPTEEGLMRD